MLSLSWLDRPGVKEFLKALSSIYDIRVFTLGIRSYAQKVLSILDPEEAFINHNVVTRDDLESNV